MNGRARSFSPRPHNPLAQPLPWDQTDVLSIMNYDPYQAPASPSGPPPLPAGGGISERAAQELIGTQGWVRFVSVLMLVGTGFMFLSLIITLMAPGTSGYEARSYPEMSGPYKSGYVAGQLAAFFFVGLLYLYPSILLARYASAIKRFRYGRSMADLEAALRHQRFFWRFIGIVSCVVLVLMLVVLATGAGLAVFGARRY